MLQKDEFDYLDDPDTRVGVNNQHSIGRAVPTVFEDWLSPLEDFFERHNVDDAR